jgi:hypothetical protein
MVSRGDSAGTRRRRVRWWMVLVGALVIVLIPVAIVAAPILLHQNGGLSEQSEAGEEWPLSVTATGDDGRERELMVLAAEPGAEVATSALAEGDRIIVSGTGYDAGQGIYVAICVIPDDAATKPGPCLGGVPEQGAQEVAEGTVQFAPSNWINDDWAWRLFGARGFDDVETGTFTAYLEVPDPIGEGIDCTVEPCAIYTRNDHTAASDRVQDVHVPVAFRTD